MPPIVVCENLRPRTRLYQSLVVCGEGKVSGLNRGLSTSRRGALGTFRIRKGGDGRAVRGVGITSCTVLPEVVLSLTCLATSRPFRRIHIVPDGLSAYRAPLYGVVVNLKERSVWPNVAVILGGQLLPVKEKSVSFVAVGLESVVPAVISATLPTPLGGEEKGQSKGTFPVAEGGTHETFCVPRRPRPAITTAIVREIGGISAIRGSERGAVNGRGAR